MARRHTRVSLIYQRPTETVDRVRKKPFEDLDAEQDVPARRMRLGPERIILSELFQAGSRNGAEREQRERQRREIDAPEIVIEERDPTTTKSSAKHSQIEIRIRANEKL